MVLETSLSYGYAKWTYNVHRIYESRNSKNTKNTYDFLVRNFLLPLSFKVLRNKERDTHSFYSGLSTCPPSRAAPVANKFVWPLRAPKVDPYRLVSSFQLNKLTFSKSPKSSRISGAGRHPQFVAPFSIWAIVTSLNDTSAPRALAWTPVLTLHLSNPCSEPKGSQPN